MTIVEAAKTIRIVKIIQEGHWHETFTDLLSRLNADTNKNHDNANSSVRYSLERLKAMTRTQPDGMVNFNAIDAMDFASRAVGVARAMTLIQDAEMDVCDEELFDEIDEVCFAMTGIARKENSALFRELYERYENEREKRLSDL